MNEFQSEASEKSGGRDPIEWALEQMRAAIAESQSALLAGRVRDLETSTLKQQQLGQSFELLRKEAASQSDSSDRGRGLTSRIVAAARQVHIQNLVLAGVLKRMLRNLDGLQRMMQSGALAYTYAYIDARVQLRRGRNQTNS